MHLFTLPAGSRTVCTDTGGKTLHYFLNKMSSNYVSCRSICYRYYIVFSSFQFCTLVLLDSQIWRCYSTVSHNWSVFMSQLGLMWDGTWASYILAIIHIYCFIPIALPFLSQLGPTWDGIIIWFSYVLPCNVLYTIMGTGV